MKKCFCKADNTFGEYKNQVIMEYPFVVYDILGEKKQDNRVSIDGCIASNIAQLWYNGIETLNSCCGHGKMKASVVVSDKSVEKMKKLGYENVDFYCSKPLNSFKL